MNGLTFLVFALIATAIDVLIPYLVLAHTGSFLASFLFWCVITLAMIIYAAVFTRPWRSQ